LGSPHDVEDWQFPGWGSTHQVSVRSPVVTRTSSSKSQSNNNNSKQDAPSNGDDKQPDPRDKQPVELNVSHEASAALAEQAAEIEAHKLGEFTSTAICGNDILASVLYTVGLCVHEAGIYAPVAMLMIVGMLYLFRSVYGEVGTALPLNGGAYNALLNTTSKKTASLAACLTILSYMATGVVSATEACDYLQNIWSDLPVYESTIILLGVFGVLALLGISESAVVAAVIFGFHTLCLLILGFAAIAFIGQNGFDVLKSNADNQDTVEPNVGRALVKLNENTNNNKIN
jgi:hypothetical protein